jgi:hypothetical protein
MAELRPLEKISYGLTRIMCRAHTLNLYFRKRVLKFPPIKKQKLIITDIYFAGSIRIEESLYGPYKHNL